MREGGQVSLTWRSLSCIMSFSWSEFFAKTKARILKIFECINSTYESLSDVFNGYLFWFRLHESP